MTNRNQNVNNYSGYQTFYPDGLSYYGEDAYYEYYYESSVPHNIIPPNAHLQRNTNIKVPKLPPQNKPRDPVVEKSSLYRKPDIPTPNNNSNFLKPILQNPAKWTDQFWQKQEEDLETTSRPENVHKNKLKPANKIEKTLNEMLAQPVQMNKGKSMLEKMGWTGGGLGKDGDGIIEPITPKATYASLTMGLGLLTEFNEQPKPPSLPKSHTTVSQQVQNKGNKQAAFSKKKGKNKASQEIDLGLREDDLQFKNYFRKNLLLKILEFVKNNKKIEIKFDAKLSKFERKRIHDVVETVRECEDAEALDFDDSEKEIVSDIMAHNNYILCTESSGKGANRCLSLFKEAPNLVYITTAHYLREERDNSDNKDYEISLDLNEKRVQNSGNKNLTDKTTDTTATSKEIPDNKSISHCIIDTDNEGCGSKKPVKPKQESVLKKIIDFFKEFANEPTYIYEEFRFLGCFNKKEADAVKMFFDICMKINVECEEATELVHILEHEVYVFTVDFDCNGNLVVFKAERSE